MTVFITQLKWKIWCLHTIPKIGYVIYDCLFLNVNWPVIKPTLNRCFTVDISIYSRMEVNLICLTFILICFHGQSLISADADPKIKHRQFVSKARADYIKVKMVRFWQLVNIILCMYIFMKKFSILLNLKKCKILLNFEASHRILKNLLNLFYQNRT